MIEKQVWRSALLIKWEKETPMQVLSSELCEIEDFLIKHILAIPTETNINPKTIPKMEALGADNVKQVHLEVGLFR